MCLAELLQQEKVQAGVLLGALGAGACSAEPQVHALQLILHACGWRLCGSAQGSPAPAV